MLRRKCECSKGENCQLIQTGSDLRIFLFRVESDTLLRKQQDWLSPELEKEKMIGVVERLWRQEVRLVVVGGCSTVNNGHREVGGSSPPGYVQAFDK